MKGFLLVTGARVLGDSTTGNDHTRKSVAIQMTRLVGERAWAGCLWSGSPKTLPPSLPCSFSNSLHPPDHPFKSPSLLPSLSIRQSVSPSLPALIPFLFDISVPPIYLHQFSTVSKSLLRLLSAPLPLPISALLPSFTHSQIRPQPQTPTAT